MAVQARQIIRIDEEKCNGCGLCVPACKEGAIEIVGGKARLVSERYCDGLGACLGECPQGAISFETREAEEFDEHAAMEYVARRSGSAQPHHHNHGGARSGFVCPSARTIDRTQKCACEDSAPSGDVKSELRQWPVKLHLVSPGASFFQNADLVIIADCVPFAYGALHPDFIRGKVVVAGCPKFDDLPAHQEKLTQIFSRNDLKSVTVLQMEVPCCSGLGRAVAAAVRDSGKDLNVETVTIGLSGEVME